ncbi:hypothetical protein GCM10027073_02060 [Streptomyces chlorus]
MCAVRGARCAGHGARGTGHGARRTGRAGPAVQLVRDSAHTPWDVPYAPCKPRLTWSKAPCAPLPDGVTAVLSKGQTPSRVLSVARPPPLDGALRAAASDSRALFKEPS